MNRQERRLRARQARAKAEIRSQQQAEQDYYHARMDTAYLEQSYTVVALALHELYGFGQMRVARVWQRMNELFCTIGGTEGELQKLRDRVRDEMDLQISWIKEG